MVQELQLPAKKVPSFEFLKHKMENCGSSSEWDTNYQKY